ncbi:hypothetical protein QFC19_006240 [Naganishia cerealis]|uniref:Uncharacterized protein n=1 Tax=Naganishia cerealis TaxID=610337 RepID=A0ACC2VIG5_9TREE|nr:hypothetical protein QFC19_006240 [Naganishia cerealis]
MSAIPHEPDLPSPSNRDSTASAIFNLYGYSTRNSVAEAGIAAERRSSCGAGLHGTQVQNGHTKYPHEQKNGELVEELQSPQTAEKPMFNGKSRTSSQQYRRASNIKQSSDASHGNSFTNIAGNRTHPAADSYIFLGTPVGADLVATGIQHEDLQQEIPNPVQSVSGSDPRTQMTNPPPTTQIDTLQPPTFTQSASNPDSSRPSSSLNTFTSVRQPGEEEDAYHVRSTYARLEVQGVFGDGWEEGIERTRERAVVSKRRESRVPPARSDVLAEDERKALAKVDRYGFFDQALKTRQENRVYRIPAQAYSKVPKVPRKPPARVKTEHGGVDMMAGGSEDTSGAVPDSISLQEIEQLGNTRRAMFRQKEAERVGKWERMLLVADRDPGGNAVKWKWEDDGKGAKVCSFIKWSAQSNESNILIHGNGHFSTFSTVSQDIARNVDTVKAWGPSPRPYCATLSQLIFIHGFPGLLENFYVQERLIEHIMPDVYTAFVSDIAGTVFIGNWSDSLTNPQERNMISASSYATKWYITLFANTVPFQTQLRIWDALLLEGRDLLVMTSLALIYAYRSVLTASNATFETILSTLSAFYIPEDEDAMMQWIRKMMGTSETRVMMDEWRKDWHELVRKKEDGTALL